ncbi:hypothetical protein [Oryza sativa Japonica Group]|uniref:Uncharacterized protein P0710A02.22 n=1 Tax=Oryza sativa subsp. japonica TaxID=39947 RepID=Q5ZD22_ORYSJ|nr:hypothetical protein [Oryza sativa Japonica Group]
MATLKVYLLLFTAFFLSGLMQLSMAQGAAAAPATRVIDAKAIDQAIAYLLMFAALPGGDGSTRLRLGGGGFGSVVAVVVAADAARSFPPSPPQPLEWEGERKGGEGVGEEDKRSRMSG